MNAEKKIALAVKGQISHIHEITPGAKCPFCGKALKGVAGYYGFRRYAHCHHCGRNAYEWVGGVEAYANSLGYVWEPNA